MNSDEIYKKDDMIPQDIKKDSNMEEIAKQEMEAKIHESVISIIEEEGILERIPEWLSEGKQMIYPERYEAWENFVNAAATDLYRTLEVPATLTIMKELESPKTIKEVLSSISNDPLASRYDRVSSFIFQFSKRGPEFIEQTLPTELFTPSLMVSIENQKKENAQLAQKYVQKQI